MSHFFYNKTLDAGFVLIAKNASSSLEPYLRNSNFEQILSEDLLEVDKSSKWFYILRNPIERFCSGIVETYLAVNYDQNGNFGTSITQQALLSLSDYAAQEFCFNLLMRIPIHNSRNRMPEDNIPVNEGLGYRDDVHTMLQSDYIRYLVDLTMDITPISMPNASNIPQILNQKLRLAEQYQKHVLSHSVKHENQSIDHKKRMNNNLKTIIMANKGTAVLDHIWDYLTPDIKLWNENINMRYMAEHHRLETIDT